MSQARLHSSQNLDDVCWNKCTEQALRLPFVAQMMRPADQQALKSFFIELVLATDMKRHFNIVSHFQASFSQHQALLLSMIKASLRLEPRVQC